MLGLALKTPPTSSWAANRRKPGASDALTVVSVRPPATADPEMSIDGKLPAKNSNEPCPVIVRRLAPDPIGIVRSADPVASRTRPAINVNERSIDAVALSTATATWAVIVMVDGAARYSKPTVRSLSWKPPRFG